MLASDDPVNNSTSVSPPQ